MDVKFIETAMPLQLRLLAVHFTDESVTYIKKKSIHAFEYDTEADRTKIHMGSDVLLLKGNHIKAIITVLWT